MASTLTWIIGGLVALWVVLVLILVIVFIVKRRRHSGGDASAKFDTSYTAPKRYPVVAERPRNPRLMANLR